MTKIRSKDLKVKVKNDSGFKKLKSKVGKKVIRSNVTKISISSKKVHIPNQAKIVNENIDEETRLKNTLRLLKHHNVNSRLDSIAELKDYIFENDNLNATLGKFFLLSILGSPSIFFSWVASVKV